MSDWLDGRGYELHYGGAFRAPRSARRLDVRSPATARSLATVPDACGGGRGDGGRGGASSLSGLGRYRYRPSVPVCFARSPILFARALAISQPSRAP